MAEVVAIHGGELEIKGAPHKGVIDLLEKFLAQARRGEIDGVAVAISRPNDRTSNAWDFGTNPFRMLASISLMHHDACASMNAQENSVAASPDPGA